MQLDVGQTIYIQSYKYDGSLHRTWSKATVLDIKEHVIVVMTYKTWVIEADGRRWFTKEPAVCFFFPNEWYNIIAMIRKTGIYYYCNVATPVLFDGEALKNIDLDLDVKVSPDGSHIILDEDEFELRQYAMDYPEEIIQISRYALNQIVELVKNQHYPFHKQTIYEYLDLFSKNNKVTSL